MDEITIVRKRSRLWPILLAVLLVAAIVFIALWLMGSQATPDVRWDGLSEFERRYFSGTA